jgi:ssDNA-binding replication factor A large subunit
MNIKDLRDGMRTVEVEGEVIEISPPREVSLRTGGQAKVADAPRKDNQIDQVAKGARVKVTNGYINQFRGERQLNVGRYGKLDIL